MNSKVIVDRIRGAGLRRALLASWIALVVAFTCVAKVQAQSETIPAAWQGVWNTTTVIRLCGNPTIIDQESFSDSLCAGRPVLDEPGVEAQCSGTVTDTSIDYTCVGSSDLGDGCTVTLTFHLLGTRTGDSYQAVETIQTTYSEDCPPFFEDSCEELTSTGTRTGGDPQCGQVPTETGSWSSLKARYH